MSAAIIEINEQNKNTIKQLISELESEKSRKRAYVSMISVNAFSKYAKNNGLNANNSESFSSCPIFLDKYDVADIVVNEKKIDIRTMVGEECSSLLIPRNHIFFGFSPDVYIAAKLNKSISKIEFLGFVTKAETLNVRGDKNYIIIDKSKLHQMEELKDTLNTIKTPTYFSIPSEHERAVSVFGAYIDNTISANDKDFLIRHMAKCPKCRREFNDFYSFDKKLKQFKDKNLLKIITTNIIDEVKNNEALTFIAAPVIPPVAILPPVDNLINIESSLPLLVEATEELTTFDNSDFKQINEIVEETILELNSPQEELTNYNELIQTNPELSDVNNKIELEDINENTEFTEVSDFKFNEVNDDNMSLPSLDQLELNEEYNDDFLKVEDFTYHEVDSNSLDEIDIPKDITNEELSNIGLNLEFNEVNNDNMNLPSPDQLEINEENDANFLRIDTFDELEASTKSLNNLEFSEDEITEIENRFENNELTHDELPDFNLPQEELGELSEDKFYDNSINMKEHAELSDINEVKNHFEEHEINIDELNDIELSEEDIDELAKNYNDSLSDELPGQYIDEYNNEVLDAIERDIELDKEVVKVVELNGCDEICLKDLNLDTEKVTDIENIQDKNEVTGKENNELNDMISALEDIEIVDTIESFGLHDEVADDKMAMPTSSNGEIEGYGSIDEYESHDDFMHAVDEKLNDPNFVLDEEYTTATPSTSQHKTGSPAKTLAIAATTIGILTLSGFAAVNFYNNMTKNQAESNMQQPIQPNMTATQPMMQNNSIPPSPENHMPPNMNNTPPNMPNNSMPPNMAAAPSHNLPNNSTPPAPNMMGQPISHQGMGNPTLNQQMQPVNNKSKQNQQIKTSSALAKALENKYEKVRIDDVKWEIGQSMGSNERLKSYLLLTGQMLKFSLSKSLVAAKTQATNNKVKVMLIFDLDGNLKYSAIRQSSGSEEVDQIMLKTIKESFSYTKMPKVDTKKAYIKINSVIDL
ncbi:MAG: DUF1822 family protein [bacterium]